jgi:hypothetical protein
MNKELECENCGIPTFNGWSHEDFELEELGLARLERWIDTRKRGYVRCDEE